MNRTNAFPIDDLKNEETGKELFRHAYAYAEKLEQQTRLLRDFTEIFRPDLAALRAKIQKKCQQVLFLSCSKRRKAEELLWKQVIYSIISQCKQHRQILNSDHPCHFLYHTHLMNATVYYEQLLHDLQDHYGIQATKLDAQQLEELETTNPSLDTLWLKEACQRCFIYLGDVARYQVDLGFSPEHSVTFYQQAITLDPSNGWPYNQLAALSESLAQPLDALYYYLRSMTATKPFSGVEKNIERLFDKNRSHLSDLESDKETVIEPQLHQFKKDLLLAKFIKVHSLFFTSRELTEKNVKSLPSSSTSSEMSTLCSNIISLLEDCMNYDEQQYAKECVDIAQNLLTKLDKQEEVESSGSSSFSPLLDETRLLKMSSLCLLPAYNLRLKGSSDTLLACAFSFSVLSLVLLFTYKKLTHLTLAVVNHQKDISSFLSFEDILESGTAMIDLLERQDTTNKLLDLDQSLSTTSDKKSTKPKRRVLQSSTQGKPSIDRARRLKKESKTKQKLKQIDRRRRRRKRGGSSSEEEEANNSLSGQSSDGSLSPLDNLGEDDLDMIDSLSESSSDTSDNDDDEPRRKPLQELSHTSPPVKTKGRRKIILAATFSLAGSDGEKPLTEQPTEIAPTTDNVPNPTVPSEVFPDADLLQLHTETDHQYKVLLACTLVSEEYYLKYLKVFIDWLLSYPAVLATYGKSSTTTIWSRLADLLNFLPSEKELHEAGLIEVDSCANWAQISPIPEDKVLRGFAPLLRIHQTLDYTSKESQSNLKNALTRIQCLIKFGHHVANSKTVPSFEFDPVSEQFMGPAQRERAEAQHSKITEQKAAEEAQHNRSKLMKVMAQRRLKSEVAALTVANAKKQAAIFTPYILPDAPTLCNSLHLVKKLMATKKFVILIAKSVIECLDQEKGNYAAREAIKFLEKELQQGNKFLRAQETSESVNPGRKKPHKQDLDIWLFDNLIDCAIYFNSGTSLTSDTSSSLVSLLLDKPLVDIFEGRSSSDDVNPAIIELVTTARQSGVEIDTLLRFYRRWQSQQVTSKK